MAWFIDYAKGNQASNAITRKKSIIKSYSKTNILSITSFGYVTMGFVIES